MTWPPLLPPNTSDNSQPQQDYHPDLHNKTADALAEIVSRMSAATVQAGRLDGTTDVNGNLLILFPVVFSAPAIAVVVSPVWGSSTSTVRREVHVGTITNDGAWTKTFVNGVIHSNAAMSLFWIAVGPA